MNNISHYITTSKQTRSGRIILLFTFILMIPVILSSLHTNTQIALASIQPDPDRIIPVPRLTDEHLAVALDIDKHEAHIHATLKVTGRGIFDINMNTASKIQEIIINKRSFDDPDPFILKKIVDDHKLSLRFILQDPESIIKIEYRAAFNDDPSKGEIKGQIHNFSVSAHIGEDGVFLSDNANWFPVWTDPETKLPGLIHFSVDIKPIEGWSLIASGDPTPSTPLNPDNPQPTWSWSMPRLIDGVALVGGKHVLHARIHQTKFGPVEIVMQTPPDNEQYIDTFMDAAEHYLDLYTPILGEFPYKRFTIIENFFSSGFAYPGFTLLGPRVVPMGKRALAPGYLDHEMIHNWWGNGVYIDPTKGNWCEALTSYCANYYRRILDDGEEAGRNYRRGILMKLASDPQKFDNAAPDWFGVRDDVNRFVGYDKGSFIFMMLEAPTAADQAPGVNREKVFKTLRKFYHDYKGKRATWNNLKAEFEKTFNKNFDAFFATWVHHKSIPVFHPELGLHAVDELKARLNDNQYINQRIITRKDGSKWLDIDPDFYIYHLIPESEIVPTIDGTLGAGGTVIAADITENDRISDFKDRIETNIKGKNLLIIGKSAASKFSELLKKTTDPISFDNHSFTVGDVTYNQPDEAVLHTMQYPGRPGRFITVFLANSDSAWSHLDYISFYSRDTTVIWQGRPVLKRRTYEPSRLIPLDDN